PDLHRRSPGRPYRGAHGDERRRRNDGRPAMSGIVRRRSALEHGGLPGHRVGLGQGLVEFALVLPVFLLVLCGLFDAGRYVYMNSVLSQASREGARLAAVEASWVGSADPSCNSAGGPVCPANAAALQTDVVAAV